MSDTTISPPFEVTPPSVEVPKGQREYQAFLRLLPQLRGTHFGKYVAIHEGNVVDCDTDDISLIVRVHARVGYMPIHVGLVDDHLAVERIPHYRPYPAKESS